MGDLSLVELKALLKNADARGADAITSNVNRVVAGTPPKGTVRVFEDDKPNSQLTFRMVGAPGTFTSEGFGGYDTAPTVFGRPAADFTQPDAERLALADLLLEGVLAARSVEADCTLLEQWARTRTVLRVVGLVPPRARDLRLVIPRGGLTPSSDPKRIWWRQLPGGVDYRIRQGYDLTLMEVHVESDPVKASPVDHARQSAADERSGAAETNARARAASALAVERARAKRKR